MATPVQSVVLGLVALALLRFIATHLGSFRNDIRTVSHIPGYRLLIHPNFLISAVVPRWSRFINIGEQYTWRYKYRLFTQFKRNGKDNDTPDIISIVSIVPHTRTVLVCDPDSIRYIVNERKKFVKPLTMYGPLAMYGPNVGVSEGAEYQRHKRIVASSNLHENINALAFQHTMRTLESCFEEWQSSSSIRQPKESSDIAAEGSEETVVRVPSLVGLTLKIGLFVILGAAFSHHPPWNDDAPESRPGDHTMSFKEAMHSVLTNVWWKIALPKFAYKLPWYQHPKYVDTSYREFTRYMTEMIRDRRLEGTPTSTEEEKQDLLGAFVGATGDQEEQQQQQQKSNETEPSGGPKKVNRARLTDQEVCSNIYVFLLAGHDTTAHTLAFTFTLLALYPRIQSKLLQEITRVLPDERMELQYEQIAQLKYPLAVFLETLRLYPSVVIIPKYCTEDTYVPTRASPRCTERTSLGDGRPSTAEGSKVLIPAHSHVFIDVPAIHYNPKYWGPDVDSFRPERFIDDDDDDDDEDHKGVNATTRSRGYRWPRDAFMAFSAGARQCLGPKFAQVEAVAIITEIIRRYEIALDPSVLLPGEGVEETRARLLGSAKTVITLTPKALPVLFKRRKMP